jgi:hypothetical protein
MAGALIIRGDRLPEIDAHGGDIDTLLKNRDGSAMTERVLVLQQIQYACLDAKGAIKVEKDGAGDVIAWVCDPGDTGGIEFYDDPGGNGLFGPGTRGQSGRCGLTSIGSSRTIAVDCRCTETLPNSAVRPLGLERTPGRLPGGRSCFRPKTTGAGTALFGGTEDADLMNRYRDRDVARVVTALLPETADKTPPALDR